jgi:hypothetical protein
MVPCHKIAAALGALYQATFWDLYNSINSRRKHHHRYQKLQEVMDILNKVNIRTIRDANFVFISDQDKKIVVFSC